MENQIQNPQNPRGKLYLKALAAGLTLGLGAGAAWNAEHSPATSQANSPVAVSHIPGMETSETTITTDAGLQPKPVGPVQATQTPETTSTTTTPTASVETEQPKPQIDLHPETDVIEPNSDVAKIMKSETVYLDGLGCSGFLIRDKAGQPIGVQTAEHCSLRDTDGTPLRYTHQRYQGSDGKTYIVVPQSVTAETGDSLKTLQAVGTIDQFIVAPSKNTSVDIAIGAFHGVSTDELLKTYLDSQLSAQEIAGLKTGDRIYMSGWPQFQPNNPGAEERQSFALSVLGTAVWNVSSGEKLHLLLAAVPMDKDGANCSFDASGSEGFIQQPEVGLDGKTYGAKTRSIGALSAFIDISGTVPGTFDYKNARQETADRQYFAQLFNVNLDNMAAICGFAYEPPTAENGRTDLQVVNNRLDIPGYTGPITTADVVDHAHELFKDPSEHNWNVIDGLVRIHNLNGGPDTPSFTWVNNPMSYFGPDGSVVLGWYDANAPDNLILGYYADPSVLDIFQTKDLPHLVQPVGEITWMTGIDQTNGEFVDGNGLRIGGMYSSDQNPLGQPYKLDLSEGGPLILAETATNQPNYK